MTLLLAFGGALPTTRFMSSADYISLHSILEFPALAVSGMVFALGWNLRWRADNGQAMLLGTGFLAVCLIDVAHTLSFPGMPNLVTPSGQGKAIFFWLAGRYTGAMVLLAVALLSPKRWSMAECVAGLMAAIGFAGGVWWIGLVHAESLPRTFIAGQGLTAFKIGAEYLLAVLYGAAAILLFVNSRRSRNDDLLWLAAAAWVQGLSEMFFTLYTDAAEVSNLLGHVFRVIAYAMVYRALFVAGVQAPYRELDRERSWLKALVMAIPDPVWLKDTAGVYLACNAVFERYFGAKEADIVGKTDYDFVGEELADFFQENDRAAVAMGGPTTSEECWAFTANGSPGLFETIKTPMYAQDRRIIGVLGIARDITERKLAEKYEQFRSQTLELLSGDASLPDILEGIVRGVEQLNPGAICSILLLDSEGKRLCKGIAPSLPDFYNAAIDGLEIGVGAGCCGTAAATGERVIADDIMTHPYWVPYRELAARARLGACWSEPIRSSSGQVLGTFAVYRREIYSPAAFDISIIEKSARLVSIAIERKRMENEIRRREREFRTLVENSPDPIFRYDRDCRRLFVHTAKIRKTTQPLESMIGSAPTDGRVLAGDEAEKLMAGIRQVFDSGERVAVDLDFVDGYGNHWDYQMLLVPELGENGEPATVLGLARDITAIRDAERQMTQFVANLPGFAFTFHLSPDGHGSFPFVSPGIEKLAGLKPADVKNDMAPMLALAHPDDAPRIIAAFNESLRTLTPLSVEFRADRPGLPAHWTELCAAPLRQADGSVLWHGIMLDIDGRKRNEAELERYRHHLEKLVEERTRALSVAKETAEAATHAKTRFLAAASHDLRQPLQAIRLFSDALAKTGLAEEQRKISRYLSKSVDSLSELLNDLLDISRLDAGIIEPQPVAIQAADLLGILGAEFDAVSREKKLRLNLFCPRRSLTLFSDDNLLLTLLRNLVSNALKYTARGGVLIGIRQRGGRALIQVWDTGIGIAPEKMDLIFDEYFQVGNPERDRAKGVGLGLAIVRRLSKLLDIEVRFRSRVGKGSVFELSVPLANESDEQATAMSASASVETLTSPRLAGQRIVIVEDDALAAEALKLSLEMNGGHVTLFGTAESALGSAEAIGADYYISDYRLPGMNGLQLLDAIQSGSNSPINAVLLTGETYFYHIELEQYSRWPVLFKPADIPTLLETLAGTRL